jgi:S-adenosylmethionine hydrolase
MASEDPVNTRPVVALLTDFGTNDAYVGVMKGVILSRAPDAQLVDLTHEVAPQGVLQGAFLLESAWRYLPAGTIFVTVVDPGVGTSRRRLAIAAAERLFIGPDNGIMSGALPEALRGQRQAGYHTQELRLPESVTAVSLEDESFFLEPRSATFEGRDVFAPVAAYLVNGGALTDLGPRVNRLLAFPAFRAPAQEGAIDGLVLYVDHFGNLITDIVARDLRPGAVFGIAGRHVSLASSYGEANGLAAIAGSSGRIEIAMPNGSAAEELGVEVGERIVVVTSSVSPSS